MDCPFLLLLSFVGGAMNGLRCTRHSSGVQSQLLLHWASFWNKYRIFLFSASTLFKVLPGAAMFWNFKGSNTTGIVGIQSYYWCTPWQWDCGQCDQPYWVCPELSVAERRFRWESSHLALLKSQRSCWSERCFCACRLAEEMTALSIILFLVIIIIFPHQSWQRSQSFWFERFPRLRRQDMSFTFIIRTLHLFESESRLLSCSIIDNKVPVDLIEVFAPAHKAE